MADEPILPAAVSDAEQRIVQARAAIESAEPEVSILPYDGSSGTARRLR